MKMFKLVFFLVNIFYYSVSCFYGTERLHKKSITCIRSGIKHIFSSTRLESSSDTTDTFQSAESTAKGLFDNEPTKAANINDYLSSFFQDIKILQGTPELVDRYSIIIS